ADEVPGLAEVVVAVGGAGVIAEVAGLSPGVADRDGRGDGVLADLVAVDVEGGGPALARAAAVVGELPAPLALAGGDDGLCLDVVARETGKVVAVLRLAVVEVEAPAGERAALGDQHPVTAAVGDDDLG